MLRWIGIPAEAAPVTVIGMTLGLTYGGGLIIEQRASGRLSRRQIESPLVLLSLCHGLIEDTLIVMAVGAHASGVLAGRIIFSAIVTAAWVRLFHGRRAHPPPGDESAGDA